MRGVFTVLCLIGLLFGQNSTAFQRGINQYQANQYSQAIQTFRGLTSGSEKSPAYVMLLMSAYADKQYQRVKTEFSNFMRSNPDELYLAQAYYIYGKALYQQGDYYRSVELWLIALNRARDPKLVRKLNGLITQAIEKSLTREQVIQLQRRIDTERAQAILAIKTAEMETAAGKYLTARLILADFVRSYPKSIYAPVAQRKIDALNSKIKDQVYIGVMLPFKDYPDISKRLMDGIQFAAAEISKEKGIEIVLKQEDCGQTVLQAIEAAKKLTNDRAIAGLIGPTNSDQFAAVSLLADQYQIPIVSPTASEHGLVDLSKFAFQFAIDERTLGKVVAEYAFGPMKQRSFAVISEESGRSFEIASGFIETIERLGGEVVSHEVYYSGTRVDFRAQFKKIHTAGIKKAFRDSVEAADPEIPQDTINVWWKKRIETAIERQKMTGVEEDSSKIIVNSIDALFMPVSQSEDAPIIEFIARYFTTQRFDINVLGTHEWYNTELFSNPNLSRIFDGMTVFKPFHLNLQRAVNRNFKNAFQIAMKKGPERFDIIGYRVMRFIGSGLEKTTNPRETLLQKLSNLDDLQLPGGPINFNHKARVNSGLRVLKFKNGVYTELD